jgi:hypothetical protein
MLRRFGGALIHRNAAAPSQWKKRSPNTARPEMSDAQAALAKNHEDG